MFGRPFRISISCVMGNWYLQRSIEGIISASTPVKSGPSRKGPPCAAKAWSITSSSSSNAFFNSAISCAVRVAFRAPYVNLTPAPVSDDPCALASRYSGESRTMRGVDGKASSSAFIISKDSQISRLCGFEVEASASSVSPCCCCCCCWSSCRRMAGTSVVGTNSLNHSGLSCRLMRRSRYGRFLARMHSHTRSQNGHQPFVSRYSVSTGSRCSGDAERAARSSHDGSDTL
mmetsp:Transcript_23905/g.43220  ORF Transcript_23905/g.43220 Transcript_23905/m.43220 type:complete len:231 (+) Transcript_23905:643-1335(+)